MAIAETQELVARLRLDASQYDAALAQVGAKTAAFEAQLKRIGQSVTQSIGAETAAMRARAAELEKIAAQSTLAGAGGRAPITAQAKAAAAAEAKALRQNAQALEDSLAQGTLAYERRAQAAVASNAAAEASELELRDSIRATTAAQVRSAEVAATDAAAAAAKQAASVKKLQATLASVGTAAKTAAVGGLKFLERTTLAAAAAGGVLEFAFVGVQDAQAALARTLTGESAASIANLNKQILEISKTVPLAVTELYRIAEVIGTTGVAVDSIDELTLVVAKLAATTDLSADEAAISISRLLNIFGQLDDKGHIAAGAAEHLADAIFRASIEFASSDQEIIRASLRFGALATAMHLTEGQVIALSGAVTGLGQEPEAVGGSFQRVFQIINKAVGQYNKGIGDGVEATKEMAKLAGLTSKQFAAGITSTEPGVAGETFLKVIEGFSKLSPSEQALLFGKGGIFPSFVRGAQTLQNLGLEFEKVRVEAAKFDETSGAFEQAFATRVNTLKQNFQLLVNAVTRGAVAFGSAFDEEMGGAIKRLTDYITENEDVFAEWGRKVADGLRSINWQQLKQFAGDFFDIFAKGLMATKAILDILGPQTSAFLLMLKTVNSLTGGAIGSLASTGIKFVVDQFAARGSSPANPVWTASVGGNSFGIPATGLTGLIRYAIPLVAAALISYGIVAALRPILEQIVPKEFLVPGGKTQGQVARENATREQNDKQTRPPKDTGFFDPSDVNWKPLSDILDKTNRLWGHGSDVGNLADKAAKAAAQYEAGMRDDLVNTQVLADAAKTFSAATNKFLEGLKPRHRQGEVGKSIQSAEFARLENIDPSKSGKISVLLEDLIKHYTQDPIGSKNHPRAFVQGAFGKVFDDIKTALKSAMSRGDQPAILRLVDNLKDLKHLGVHLPAGLRHLIRKAEQQHKAQQDTKDAIDKEKTKLAGGIETSNERIAFLRQTLANKKLSTTVKPSWTANVRAPSVHVTPIVRVTVGARTITRYIRGTTSYGPGLVLMQTGTGGAAVYSGGGGP